MLTYKGNMQLGFLAKQNISELLIKIKNNQSSLDIEKIGADFYSYLKSNSFFKSTFYELNIKNINSSNESFSSS